MLEILYKVFSNKTLIHDHPDPVFLRFGTELKKNSEFYLFIHSEVAVQISSLLCFKLCSNLDVLGDLFSGTKEAADRFVTPF